MMNNVTGWDRFFRALLAVAALLLAVFWLPGAWAWMAYAVGAVLLLTALTGFCPVYRLLGTGPRQGGASAGKSRLLLALLLLLASAAAGAWASQLFSRKMFLEDFNAMNGFYKQTLFLTGKGEREKALKNYEQLLPAYAAFKDKYLAWQPVALRGDAQLAGDLAKVDALLKGVDTGVRSGDLQQTHLALEGVRPVFQDIFKRNGFSMLAVSLVDFHDAMELMLDAGIAKDAPKLIALYPGVDAKMKAIEAEAGDADIVAIRSKLDGLWTAAQTGQLDSLPALADQLKSSFVKVYLQRG